MCQTLKSVIGIWKKEGPRSVIKRAITYTQWIIYYPYCFLKIGKLNNPDKAFRFAFEKCKGLIEPAQVQTEISQILEILKKEKPKYVMEIGTGNGGNLLLFSRTASDDAKIISLDLRGGGFGGGYAFWRIPLYKSFALRNQKIHLVNGDSHKKETLEKIKKILNGKKLDFLFIDGDHTYEGAKKDFEMYKEIVKEKGTIALHDIAKSKVKQSNVDKLWKEIKQKYNGIEFIEDKDQGWGGIGVIKKN